MAISTYAELQTAVANWLDRADYTARIPEFIELAEARLRRVVDGFEMEARATVTATGEFVTLPPDFETMRHLALLADGAKFPLRQIEYAQMQDIYRFHGGGRPEAYAVLANRIALAPAPSSDGVTLEMVYRRTLPRLSVSAPTNWLLADHPDIYLFSTLLQAEFYGWNDERLRLMKPALDEMIAELEAHAWDKRAGAAPLAPAVRRLK